MPLSGSAGVSKPASNVWMIFCTSRNDDHAAVRQLLRHFGERADRHDALGAIVKLIGLPAVVAQFLGEQMGVLGGLDERVAYRPASCRPRTICSPASSCALVCRIVLPRNVATWIVCRPGQSSRLCSTPSFILATNGSTPFGTKYSRGNSGLRVKNACPIGPRFRRLAEFFHERVFELPDFGHALRRLVRIDVQCVGLAAS